jgi:hypothetical protein
LLPTRSPYLHLEKASVGKLVGSFPPLYEWCVSTLFTPSRIFGPRRKRSFVGGLGRLVEACGGLWRLGEACGGLGRLGEALEPDVFFLSFPQLARWRSLVASSRTVSLPGPLTNRS